jgi:hypothetical protein
MAKNWTAYEAAKEIYGDNKENIAEIGSRFPLFARTIAILNNDYVLDILKAIPKVTARVVETGLKEMEVGADVETDAETEAEEKPVKNTKKTKSAVEEDDAEGTYESMTSKELYVLCCKRGISSKCKSRSKDALIELLNKYDAGELDDEPKAKAGKKTKPAKKAEPVEEDEDEDWDDDEEEEEKDPYAGKTAKELFAMCKERGLKTKPKQSAESYAKLLKEDDAADADDEDDEWEI